MNIADFKAQKNWTKISAGTSHLLLAFHLGESLLHANRVSGEPVFQHSIYFQKSGVNETWSPQSDRDFLGARLIELYRSDSTYLDTARNDLRSTSDGLNALIQALNPSAFTANENNQLWDTFDEHYLPHVCVKYIADYLSDEELERELPALQDIRRYIEPTYNNLKQFMLRVAESFSQKTGYSPDHILSTIKSEFNAFLQIGALPSKEILGERFLSSALLFDAAGYRLFVGDTVKELESIVARTPDSHQLIGQSAFKGKVTGRVHIVLDASAEADSFKEGEILVTGMTRPDYLPLMQKAAAFITDSGGVLTHAAISAREMKKPCIIGTEMGTQVLQNGDLVEVDAEKGVVKRIENYA